MVITLLVELLLIVVRHLSDKLGYKRMEDWYNISNKDFKEHGGASLVVKYKSPSKLLMEIYNEHNWHPWKFTKTPVGYWEKLESQHQFLSYLF